jgi:hypothetical protein
MQDLSLLHSVQTSAEDHPASYPIDTDGSFSGGKEGGAEVKNGGAIPPQS